MPSPIIYETPRSREGAKQYAGATLTREYFVAFQDFVGLYALLDANVDATFQGFDRKSYTHRSLGAPDCWIVTVEYGSSDGNGGLLPDQFSFKLVAAGAHITQSLVTLNGIQAADLGLAGVNLTVDAAADTQVLPDGYSPSPGDVGWVITVTGGPAGAGWMPGAYRITGLTTPTGTPPPPVKWILSANPAPAGAVGGVWNKGNTLFSGTNLTVDAVLDDDVLPDGYTPVATDVGRQIAIVSGTGFALGVYTIEAIFAGDWQFDRTPAAVGTAGGVWYMLGTAPSSKGAIGVNLDTVQGCEIVIPQSELTFSSNLSSMTAAYVQTARGLIGMTNNAPFLGYPTGTLLYLGMEPTSPAGSLPGTGAALTFWNLAHSFRYEPDVTNVPIGDFTVPYKPGHAYLWVRYAPTVQPGAQLLGQKPVAVYVEQVYRSGDMTALGISL